MKLRVFKWVFEVITLAALAGVMISEEIWVGETKTQQVASVQIEDLAPISVGMNDVEVKSLNLGF